MSADAQQLIELTVNIHLLWSAPFQIIMAVVFLWKELGPSVLAGVAVLLFVIHVNALIAAKVKRLKVRYLNNHSKERLSCHNIGAKVEGINYTCMKNTIGTSKLNAKQISNTKPQLFFIEEGSITAVRQPYV